MDLPDIPNFDPERAIVALESQGWTRWRGHGAIWKSPAGELFLGPAMAYKILLKMGGQAYA